MTLYLVVRINGKALDLTHLFPFTIIPTILYSSCRLHIKKKKS